MSDTNEAKSKLFFLQIFTLFEFDACTKLVQGMFTLSYITFMSNTQLFWCLLLS